MKKAILGFVCGISVTIYLECKIFKSMLASAPEDKRHELEYELKTKLSSALDEISNEIKGSLSNEGGSDHDDSVRFTNGQNY